MYRLSSNSISRGKGQSAVNSLAYRTGKCLYDEKLEKHFDYSNKPVSHYEILLPENANSNYLDVEKLGNAIEKSEVRKNSELMKEYVLTLPLEFSKEQQIKLVNNFAKKYFLSKGLGVCVAFHGLEDKQPHCHLTTTTRSFGEDGALGKKERFLKDKSFLIDLRKEWEKSLNLEFQILGINKAVSAESLRKQGLNLQPINSNYKDREQREEHIAKIKAKNAQSIIKEPNQIANFLTHNKAVFTDKELQQCLIKYVGEENLKECYKAVFKSENTILLDKELKQFTSVEYQLREIQLFNSVDKLNNTDFSKELDSNLLRSISKDMTLTVEQKCALYYATRTDSNIKNIQGFAGSGKSHTMKAIAESYKLSGYNCRGLALSGIISDNIANDCNIKSSTIASFLLSQENENINSKNVFIIDEASMIGTRDYQKILQIAEEKNCKVVSVGDDNQLQAIQSGGVFRGICENTSSITLSEIRRQKEHQDRLATLNFSTGKTREALEHYNNKGCIHFHKNQNDLVKDISNRYLQDLKETGKTSIILAHANKDVLGFNKYIHEQRKSKGELGNSLVVKGTEYSEKDRFVFLDNDYALGVKNGTTGTIERIKGNEFQINLDNKDTTINFNVKDYDKFAHAYALTIHKSQGITVEKTQIYADTNINNNLALVGCSRHKESLQIHCLEKSKDNEKGFKNFDDLVQKSERKQVKELVQDKLIQVGLQQPNDKALDVLKEHSKEQKKQTEFSQEEQKNIMKIMKALELNEKAKDLNLIKAKATGYSMQREVEKEIKNVEDKRDLILKNIDKENKTLSPEIKKTQEYQRLQPVMEQYKEGVKQQQLEKSMGYSMGMSF